MERAIRGEHKWKGKLACMYVSKQAVGNQANKKSSHKRQKSKYTMQAKQSNLQKKARIGTK